MSDGLQHILLAEVHFQEPPIGGFTYRVPVEWALVEAGCRVRVPFGRQKRIGYVTRVYQGESIPGLKDLGDLIDETPLLSPELLSLTQWLAEYYLCDWGEAIAAATPAGLKPRGKPRYRLTKAALAEPWIESEAGPSADLWRMLATAPLTLAQIKNRHAEGVELFNRFRKRGWLEAVEPVQEKVTPKFETIYRWSNVIDTAAALESLPKTAARQSRIVGLFGRRHEWSGSEIRKEFPASKSALMAIEKRGWIESKIVEVSRLNNVQEGLIETAGDFPDLSSAQQSIIETVTQSITKGEYEAFLLHGVTGSGKSLIYLKAVEAALREGKGAIVMVPEISLTPQLAGRLRRVFGERVAITHSGIPSKQRQEIWQLARQGSVKVVVGPRSAIFAPVEKLGLIVVDEEHDDSYKQETPPPRYHGRAAALFRGKQAGATVLLGSATPDIVTYHYAVEGRLRLLELPVRHQGGSAPDVWVVKWGASGSGSLFSPQLRSRMEQRFEKNEQIILLLNRRGFSTQIICPDCGATAKCPNCDITLRYHRVGVKLECHYCGFSQRAIDRCPECNGARLRYGGIGTQRVERELELLYPKARVARLDLDTSRQAGGANEALRGIAEGRFDILLGTQMVAKGHDFPKVTLVGILGADGELLQPDFRSLERTFRLLVQASGRTARDGGKGEVVIQCLNPTHPLLRWVQAADYKALYDAEIEFRRTLRYPPFGRLISITLKAEDQALVAAAAGAMKAALDKGNLGIPILGPATPGIERLDGLFRRRFILKLPPHTGGSISRLKAFVRTTLDNIIQKVGRDKLLGTIDVDPVET